MRNVKINVFNKAGVILIVLLFIASALVPTIGSNSQYQNTMKDDKMSNATLAFYKDKVVSHCGTIVAKVQYEENFFSNLMIKDTFASVDNCKVSIEIAKTYAASDTHNFKVLEAYQENVVDNCGTLVAKKAPAFCMYDLAAL